MPSSDVSPTQAESKVYGQGQEHTTVEIASFPLHHSSNQESSDSLISQSGSSQSYTTKPSVFHHLLAYATINKGPQSTSSLIIRQNMEEQMCQSLKPVSCTPATLLFPPFEHQTDSQGLNAIKEEGIDGLLLISMSEDASNPTSAHAVVGNTSQEEMFKQEQARQAEAQEGTAQEKQRQEQHIQTQSQQEQDTLPAFFRGREGKVVLISVTDAEPVWGGAFEGYAEGLNHQTNQDFAKSLTKPLAEKIKLNGLVSSSKEKPSESLIPSEKLLWWLDPSKAPAKESATKVKETPTPKAKGFVF